MNESLPDGWTLAQISDVTDEIPNANPKSQPEREFKYVDISSIDNSTFTLTGVRLFKGKNAPSRARRPIQPNDVLFSNVRTYLRNVALVPVGGKADLCSTGFTVLRPNAAVIPRYLFRYVLSDDFIDRVTPQQTGAHYPATSDRVVMTGRLPLPPIAEQRRIVAKLEQVIEKNNACQTRLADVTAVLRRFRQSVLYAACSGSLTADWRSDKSDIEPAQVLIERIENHRRMQTGRRKPFAVVDRVPADEYPEEEIPETWQWVRFGSVLGELRNGVSPRPSLDPPGTPILRISAARPGRVDLTDIRYLPNGSDYLPTFAVKDKDLLFTRYNGSIELLGVCAMVRSLGRKALLYPDKLIRVRFDHEFILPEYAEVFFQAPHVHERVVAKSKSSAGQNGISGSDIKAQLFAVPPLREQEAIARRVSELFALATRIEERVTAAQVHVRTLSPLVLAKAFSGELVQTEAELAHQEGREYESASVLLDRVQRDREREVHPHPSRNLLSNAPSNAGESRRKVRPRRRASNLKPRKRRATNG